MFVIATIRSASSFVTTNDKDVIMAALETSSTASRGCEGGAATSAFCLSRDVVSVAVEARQEEGSEGELSIGVV